jgi:hypothetical protein
VAGVREAVEGRGARLRYLPPYSPDYSPTEPMWSKVKEHLRSAKARTDTALIDAMADGLRSVTAADSLYDAFTERYGEPIKRSEQVKMIGLKQDELKVADAIDNQDLHAGRQFQLHRQPPKSNAHVSERAGTATLYVRGATPLHLRMVAFDRFDGVQWHESPAGDAGSVIVQEPGKPEFAVKSSDDDSLLADEVSHQIRVGGLGGDKLPMPAHVRSFRMGRVDQANSFAWSQEGISKLSRRSFPCGSAIDVISRTIEPDRVR